MAGVGVGIRLGLGLGLCQSARVYRVARRARRCAPAQPAPVHSARRPASPIGPRAWPPHGDRSLLEQDAPPPLRAARRRGPRLQHRGSDLGEVPAQEARVRLGNLDQQLQRVLRGALLALVQQPRDDRQLRRHRALEAVALARVVQLLPRARTGLRKNHRTGLPEKPPEIQGHPLKQRAGRRAPHAPRTARATTPPLGSGAADKCDPAASLASIRSGSGPRPMRCSPRLHWGHMPTGMHLHSKCCRCLSILHPVTDSHLASSFSVADSAGAQSMRSPATQTQHGA